jgi:hypothetical protein
VKETYPWWWRIWHPEMKSRKVCLRTGSSEEFAALAMIADVRRFIDLLFREGPKDSLTCLYLQLPLLGMSGTGILRIRTDDVRYRLPDCTCTPLEG